MISYPVISILVILASVLPLYFSLDLDHSSPFDTDATFNLHKGFEMLSGVTMDELQDITAKLKKENGINLATTSSPSCQSFSTLLRTEDEILSSTCAQAVTYSFYVPAGVSLASLESAARSRLSSSSLSALPNACLVSLLKLVCANVYLKCIPGTSPTDMTYKGWNFAIYDEVGLTIPIPFERPCQNLCTSTNTNCLGLLSLLESSQNCSATYNYAGLPAADPKPFQYDASNNYSVCNPISASVSLGLPYESYQGGVNGVCYGIVEQLYVFPATKVNTTLAPLQAPHVVQSIIESTLKSKLAILPPFVSADCQFALRKYFCRTAFPGVVNSTFGQAIAAANLGGAGVSELEAKGVNIPEVEILRVYVPSFPSYSVCESYSNICGAFIELANKTTLVANCSSRGTVGTTVVELYPNTTQTIVDFVIPVETSSVTLKFSSAPDDVSNTAMTSSDYTTYCPQGYVVPSDPSDSRITWVTGTGCAVSCQRPLYTDKEYQILDRVLYVLSIIGIPGCFLVFVIWITDEKRRKQETVIMYAFFGLVYSISTTLIHTVPGAEVCVNNGAVGIDSRDGANVCNATSFVNMYTIFACGVAWALTAVDKFLSIGLGWKALYQREFNILAVIIYPLIIVIGAAGTKLWGFSYGPKVCILSGANGRDFNIIGIFIIPLLVLVFLTLFAYVSTLTVILSNRRLDVSTRSILINASTRKIVSVKNQENKSSFTQVPKDDNERNVEMVGSTNTPHNNSLPDDIIEIIDIGYEHNIFDILSSSLFSIVFFSLWIVYLAFRLYGYKDYYVEYDSLEDWTRCAMLNYVPPTQDWHYVCGYYPSWRVSYGLESAAYIFLIGQTTIFSGIFLINPQLWWELYAKFRKLLNPNWEDPYPHGILYRVPNNAEINAAASNSQTKDEFKNNATTDNEAGMVVADPSDEAI